MVTRVGRSRRSLRRPIANSTSVPPKATPPALLSVTITPSSRNAVKRPSVRWFDLMTSRGLRLGAAIAALGLVTIPARAADDTWALPQKGTAAAAFAPRGWSIEETLEGDLDADGVGDQVIALLQDEPASEAPARDVERRRALVLLLRRAGGYTLGGFNRQLLMSFGDGGVRGGVGTPELKLQRGSLVVSQMQGSREFSIWEQRLRWSRKRQRFELIGEDTTRADAANGSSTWDSCNLLTRVCVETVTP